MEELYNELEDTQSITQKYLGLSTEKFFVLFMLVVLLGIYLGIIFYGSNSLEVFFGLEDYEEYLHSEITTLKVQNANLQMQYFELKEISAQ
jgi:cell division protein FtsL